MARRTLAAAAALLLGCASGEPPGAPFRGAGDYDLELEHDGRRRSYYVHLPPRFAERGPLPVVLSFHGGGGAAASHKAWVRLDRLADREGFVAVYPDGTGRFGRRLLTWNAGTCCGLARRRGVDDTGYALALLDQLARWLPLDHTRVYATGMSNGAMMAYRLAAEAGDRIAAIAPVGAAMALERFAPRRPVPVLHFHSVDDPRALYAGGLGPPFPFTRSRVQHNPVEAELARWAEVNGCASEPRETDARSAPADRFDAGHTAIRLEWGPCSSGAEVALWKLTGAGHVWPGSPDARAPRLLGAATRVVDANEEMWRFFRRHSRPDAPAPPVAE